MFLKEFININEAGAIETAVDLEWMNDPARNLQLCQSFVFNYNSDRPSESTVGLLEILRRSFHSRNEKNIHCVVQDYGKGKTHFALAIANFFSKAPNSPEVTGILNSIKNATGEKNKAIFNNLEAYKRSKHLVFCLGGQKFTDLRKHFLQVVLSTLEKEGIKKSIGHQLCARPLKYLEEELDENKKALANRYLKKVQPPVGDLDTVCELLHQNNYEILALVIEMCDAITNNYAPDFTKGIEIESILQDLVKNLCTGTDKRYEGILILFDELNNYLDSWIHNKIAAGGTAMQNITEACLNNKAKIALMSFTQVNPNSKGNREGYQIISTRLAKVDTTYSPVSSLEKVIGNVILKEGGEKKWQDFRKKWDNTLWANSERIYKLARKYQDKQDLNLKEFHDQIGLGCFPLHPLTGYLLCNLDFTQGRTAIEFVKKEVGEFLAQPTELQQPNRPNYLHAISLVDAFAPNFKTAKEKAEIYGAYLNVLDSIRAEADLDEISVVKAIFLYAVSSELIIKSPHEPHEKILADLSGLPEFRLREALDRLQNECQSVYRRPDGIHQFFTGTNPRDLEQRVIAEIEEQIKVSSNLPQLETIFANYCRDNLDKILGEESTKASQFASENGLNTADWCFINQIYTIAEFEKLLQKKQTITEIRNRGYQGIVAHVIDSSTLELDGLWDEIDDLLQKSPIKERLVVAIAKQSLGEEEDNLGRILKKIETLKTKFKSDQGTPAYSKLLSGWETEIRDRSHEMFNKSTSMRHHSISGHKITLQEKRYANFHVSALLKDLYPFIPNMGNVDKLSVSPNPKAGSQTPKIHATGTKIAPKIASLLFANKGQIVSAGLQVDSSHISTIDSAFVNSWGLFKKTSSAYILQEPTNQKVRDAWEQISKICDLKGEQKKEIALETIWKLLSDAPYGYNQLNFTVLLAGWLSFHRHEVSMRGIPDPTKKGKAKNDQSMQLKALEEWAASNIFEKADTFVDEWIVKLGAKLIRSQRVPVPVVPTLPTDYEKAIAYTVQAKSFLETNTNTPEVNEVKEWHTRLTKVIKDFDNWYKPIQESVDLSLDTAIEKIVQLYPQVVKECPVTDIARTSSQDEKQHQARQRLQQIIEERVRQLQAETENLDTVETCISRIGNIDSAVRALSSVENFPVSYVQDLEKSKAAISQRQQAIETHKQITQKLREVQSRYEGLSQNATQQELTDAQTAIAQFAEVLPAIKHEAKYQEILQNISDRDEQLKQQLQIWNSRSLNNLSQLEYIKLREELVKQESRYTFAEDKKQLKELLSHLERKIENDKSSQTIADDNKKSISQAGEFAKSIGEAKSIGQMFDNYKLLQSLHIRTHADLDTREVENRLSQLKDSGLKSLGDRIMRELIKCDLVINKQEEYNQRKNVLQQLQVFLPISEEFNDICTEKESAANNLEVRYREFVTREKIRKIIKYIVDLPLSLNSTIRHCEESLQKINNSSKEITDLSKQNNNIVVDCTEINNCIKQFEDQIAKQCEELTRLQHRIEAISDPKELDIFKTDYARV